MTRNQSICDEVIAGESMTAVAERRGLTRERVRQILMATVGLSAADLRDAKAKDAKPKPVRKMRDAERYFAEAATEAGLQVVWCDSHFECFGKSVAALLAFPRYGEFSQIYRPSENYDFAAWMFPFNRWLILPNSRWPTPVNMLSIEPRGVTGPGITYDGKKHDYYRYVNRWDLLGGKVKINEPISATEVPDWRNRNKYLPLVEKINALPDGMALPVECDDPKDAQNCQYAIFGFQNKVDGPLRGKKYSVARRKNMVYISRAKVEPA